MRDDFGLDRHVWHADQAIRMPALYNTIFIFTSDNGPVFMG